MIPVSQTGVLPQRGAATRDQIAPQVAGVDAIEVKATIADKQIDDAVARFNLTIDNDEERHIYFFDTPDRDLLNAGIILRSRRIVGDQHDSTVKFRPVVPSEVPKQWAKAKGFKLEADASEKGIVRSASLTAPVEKGLIKRVVSGKKPIHLLLSHDQNAFLKAMADHSLDFESLTIFGPLRAAHWEFTDPSCPWPVTVELWHRTDGARLMEASVKAPMAQSAVAIAGFIGLLAELGAERDLEEHTKTRWALALPPARS